MFTHFCWSVCRSVETIYWWPILYNQNTLKGQVLWDYVSYQFVGKRSEIRVDQGEIFDKQDFVYDLWLSFVKYNFKFLKIRTYRGGCEIQIGLTRYLVDILQKFIICIISILDCFYLTNLKVRFWNEVAGRYSFKILLDDRSTSGMWGKPLSHHQFLLFPS